MSKNEEKMLVIKEEDEKTRGIFKEQRFGGSTLLAHPLYVKDTLEYVYRFSRWCLQVSIMNLEAEVRDVQQAARARDFKTNG